MGRKKVVKPKKTAEEIYEQCVAGSRSYWTDERIAEVKELAARRRAEKAEAKEKKPVGRPKAAPGGNMSEDERRKLFPWLYDDAAKGYEFEQGLDDEELAALVREQEEA